MTPAEQVIWTASARRDLSRLPEKVAAAVVEFVYGSLIQNPRRVGRELHFELTGLHAARRGDFRVIQAIDETGVTIVTVNHRADVYRRR